MSKARLAQFSIAVVLGCATASPAWAYQTSGFMSWTIAGTGTFCGSSTAVCGDGGAATGANLAFPEAVAVDGAGNVYIADTYDQRIRRLTPGGTITTIAGTGTPCSSATATCGDGGAATSANLNFPEGVAVDGTENVYIADTGDQRIRKLTPGGTITTIAGNGTTCSPTTAPCGDGGAATSANLTSPWEVAVDGTANVYIADAGDNRIRKVTGATITTIAGNGTACGDSTTACGDGGAATSANLNSPLGLAVDPGGNIYIADTNDNRIRKVTGGTITTIAGNGTACSNATSGCGDGNTATNANLKSPAGVAVDGAGNVYIADSVDRRIREAKGGLIMTVAGNGTACSAATAACGDGGAATSGNLSNPSGVALDAAGNLYVADTNDDRIRWLTGPQAGVTGAAGSQGPLGAEGSVGAQGPGGAPGPAGAQGQAGTPGALVLAAYQTVKSAKRVTVRYALTGAAAVTLKVKPPHGQPVVVAHGNGRKGLNKIAWNRKLHGKRAARGLYKLMVGLSSEGHNVTSTISARL